MNISGGGIFFLPQTGSQALLLVAHTCPVLSSFGSRPMLFPLPDDPPPLRMSHLWETFSSLSTPFLEPSDPSLQPFSPAGVSPGHWGTGLCSTAELGILVGIIQSPSLSQSLVPSIAYIRLVEWKNDLDLQSTNHWLIKLNFINVFGMLVR